MANIAGYRSQGISADRLHRTVVDAWTGAQSATAYGTPVSLAVDQFHLAKALILDIVTTLNSGTVSGGAFGAQVSYDGVHWIDSGANLVTVPTGDGGVAAIFLSVYSSPRFDQNPAVTPPPTQSTGTCLAARTSAATKSWSPAGP